MAAKVDEGIDVIKKSLKKNGYKDIKIPSGLGGKVMTTTVLYDDYQKYSGINLYLAWGVDAGVNYGAGKIGGLAAGSGVTGFTGNPLLGIGVYAGVGIISDGISSGIKDWLLTPDHK